MIETTAIFTGKESKLESQDCVIAKVIRLPEAAFDSFSNNLLRDHDFIKENNTLMGRGEDGKRHCMLVVGEGRRDGILVDSSGYDYARYTALLPNAEDFLNANRYPALAALNKKLVTMVDTIVEQVGAGNSSGHGVVNLHDWGEMLGIDFAFNNTLRSAVLDMLESRPEIRHWELDKNELTVFRKVDLSELPTDAESISDPNVTLADMYAYGYTWDGMIPLGKDRALELFKAGHEIFHLYTNDSEYVIETSSDIEFFSVSGMFGVRNPSWTKPECTPEHGSKEKPSVMDEIRASRRSSLESKSKPPSKMQEKDVQKTKKNKGGHDL